MPLERLRRTNDWSLAFRSDPQFWPLRAPSASFAECDDWPAPEQYDRVFAVSPPVRFVTASPRARRSRTRDPRSLYDARIARDRIVPTRARNAHDFFNALVWGAFPRAKLALHARQDAAIDARIEPGAARLPAHRSRELDALALFDEGGIVVATSVSGAIDVVFGHAIFEHLAAHVGPLAARVVTVHVDGALARDEASLRAIDAALARALATSACSDPDALPRCTIDSTATELSPLVG